jgi:DNA-binding transcriptional ArsR family regulator
MARAQSDATAFNAIACPTRRAMLEVLAKGERNASALVDQLGLTQPAISQQLAVLKSAGLVTERQNGRFRYYRARTKPLREIQQWIERYRMHADQLDKLGKVLDAMGEA